MTCSNTCVHVTMVYEREWELELEELEVEFTVVSI